MPGDLGEDIALVPYVLDLLEANHCGRVSSGYQPSFAQYTPSTLRRIFRAKTLS